MRRYYARVVRLPDRVRHVFTQMVANPQNGVIQWAPSLLPRSWPSSLSILISSTRFSPILLLQHRLNFRALSRALSIRTQLSKYLTRFDIPLISCGTDFSKVLKCVVSGYFRNAAVWKEDGTFRSIKEGAVSLFSSYSTSITAEPRINWRMTYVDVWEIRFYIFIPPQFCSREHRKLNMSFTTKWSKLQRGSWGRLRVSSWIG